MKTHILFERLLLALLVAAAGALTGCSSCKPGGPPGPPLTYSITVTPGESLKGSSVVVDLVAINPSELGKWQTYSLKKYFAPRDPMRQDALKVTASFSPGEQTAFVLQKADANWQTWLGAGAQYLVIVADLPGVFDEGKPGSQDPRRQLVPLCKCFWPPKTQNIDLKVQAGGVTLVTTPRQGYPQPVW